MIAPANLESVSADTIRGFVAIGFDQDVVRRVALLQRRLSTTRVDVRWVHPERLHVTLKFFGKVETTLVPRLQRRIGDILQDRRRLFLRVRDLGVFPSLRQPSVLWVGVAGDGLAELANDIDTAAEGLGFEREGRPFHGHMTLGRVKSMHGWRELEELFMEHRDDDFGSTEVRSVVFYRSTLQPGGSVYSALWTIPLHLHKGKP